MSAPQNDLKESYDVVVVGAGGAGMAAALTAAAQGLDVALIEKSAYFGGSTARSGGGVWIPGNYALKAAGQVDPGDAEAAKTYLASIVGDKVSQIRRETYLDRGPEAMDFLKDRIPTRFTWVPNYADYLPEQPGGRPAGRSVEPIP
ncbi:MAG TPA: FAD-dependent oxidoreductase, partial [Marmoricola sp.]|nr:FAD-dependent oxidoreductase [Marmoricola sp.]